MPSSEPWRCASDCAAAHCGVGLGAVGEDERDAARRASISPLSRDRELAARERGERQLDALVGVAAGVGATTARPSPRASWRRGAAPGGGGSRWAASRRRSLRGVDAEEAA